MAKFCSNCGKKLEEGKICDCKQNAGVIDNELVSKGINIIKNIFVKPIDTIKEYTHAKNFTFSLILTAIMSFLTALFMMPVVKEFSVLIYGVSEMTLYNSFVQAIEIPYLKIFFGSFIISFALTFVFTGVLYLTNTIMFKGKADFKTIYSLYGVCSIITSASLAVGTILVFLNVILGLIVLLSGIVLNMIYMIYGVKFIGPKDENKFGYIYLIALALNTAVVTFLLKVFS